MVSSSARAPSHPLGLGDIPLSPPEERPVRKQSKWERTFTVKCATPAQKAQIQAAAEKAGLNLTQFVIYRTLNTDPEEGVWKERAKLAEENAKQWRSEQMHARAEAEEAKRRVRDLERQLAEVQRHFAEHRIAFSQGDATIELFDARAMHLIGNSKREGAHVPITLRDLIDQLDLQDAQIPVLTSCLARLAEWGIIQRVEQNGKASYLWRARA